MKIFEDVRRRLLRTFNTRNNQNIPFDKVSFGNPVPYDSLVPVPGQTGADYGPNTAVSLRMLPGAPFTGETQLYYNRLPLGRAFRHAPLKTVLAVKATNEKTVHELIPQLNRRLGTSFKTRDLVNAPLDLSIGFMRLTLVAAPTSYEWVGSVELAVWGTDRGNEFDFVNVGKLWQADDASQLSVSGYPTNVRWPVALATYHIDYTPQQATLRAFAASDVWAPLSDANATTLANALKAVDGRGWLMSTNITPYNLRGTSIYYNGKVATFVPTGILVDDPGAASIVKMLNSDYDNVLIARADWPWKSASGFRSFLIVHYNDPL